MKYDLDEFCDGSIAETEKRVDGMIAGWQVWHSIPWVRPVNLDGFTRAYVDCALWSWMDVSNEQTGGHPMDKNYTIDYISDETLGRMAADCQRFLQHVWSDKATPEIDDRTTNDVDSIHGGHDFWLTRNGHGCGFWDGDWEETAGEQLTQLSKSFGEFNLYIGDDGRIYS